MKIKAIFSTFQAEPFCTRSFIYTFRNKFVSQQYAVDIIYRALFVRKHERLTLALGIKRMHLDQMTEYVSKIYGVGRRLC
jgi:hypothetical protein